MKKPLKKQKKEEQPIQNVTEFSARVREAIRKLKQGNHCQDFLFRGQPIDEPLIPRLGRHHEKWRLIQNFKDIEKAIIDEFKRTCLPLVEMKPQDDWDIVAIAQHHGLPTRLLDWTTSALAALWFAVRNPPIKGKDKIYCNGIVWIFKPDAKDYRRNLDKSNPFSNKKTKLFRPKVIGRRISAQGGVFTVHRINNGEQFLPLEENVKYKKKLVKLVIAPKYFAKLRKELDFYNGERNGVRYIFHFTDTISSPILFFNLFPFISRLA